MTIQKLIYIFILLNSFIVYFSCYSDSEKKEFCKCNFTQTSSRILNGTIANPNNFRWDVLILVEDGNTCGGTILNEFWVLSAAHCFKNFKEGDPSFVLAGHDHDVIKMMNSPDKRKIVEVIKHARYNNSKKYIPKAIYDLALLKVKRPFNFGTISNVYPACFLNLNFEKYEGNLYMIGYGANNSIWANRDYLKNKTDMQHPNNLLQVPAKNIQEECRPGQSFTNMHDLKNIVCAFNEQGSACFGDSGSSLNYLHNNKMYVIGVLCCPSRVIEEKDKVYFCAESTPIIYTRIFFVLCWIKKYTTPMCIDES